MAARPKGACESDSISNRETVNGLLQSTAFLELVLLTTQSVENSSTLI
jgi:hypothetical protein